MAYIKTHTTLALVFFLIFTILVYVGSIVYFQNSLVRLNDVVSERNRFIDSQSGEISSLKLNVSKLETLINIQIKREENLSQQFLGLKGEKQEVLEKKAEVESNLKQIEEELLSSNLEIEQLHVEIEEMEKDYSSLNNTLTNVLEDAEEICDQASSLNISECEDYT